jgi:hypothetical protein
LKDPSPLWLKPALAPSVRPEFERSWAAAFPEEIEAMPPESITAKSPDCGTCRELQLSG